LILISAEVGIIIKLEYLDFLFTFIEALNENDRRKIRI
jgi:hypothetical protein